jgi:capsular exopolysaccharide synthesis family protein
VVTEVPKASRGVRQRYVVAALSEPDGSVAEAYRTLRSALTLMPSLPLALADDSALAGPTLVRDSLPGPPKIIVVTAPTAGVGKTTTAANLAACLAEAGKSVLVLDCDLRHPESHLFFRIENTSGLSDALAEGKQVDLAAIVRPTRVSGVSLVPAGTASWMPTRLVQHVDSILAQAQALADVVVIDSPPLLGSSEAADLAAHADSVIVAAWAGRTTAEHAERTVELLSRVGAPALGVALVTTSNTVTHISGMGNQRIWPMNIVDRRSGRLGPRERSRAASRGIRGR